MPLPKYMTTVTPFSKILALSMFVIFPILGFYLGMQYQKAITPHKYSINIVAPKNAYPSAEVSQTQTVTPQISCRPRPKCLDSVPRCMIAETSDMCPPETNTIEPKACAQDAKQCPDGSYVGRTGPNCEFTACPK